MSSQDLPKPDFVRNMKLIGYSDQGGREDGVQVMVNKGHAFVGHMFSKGFSVIDVRDPRNPEAGEIHAGAAQHLDHPSPDPRRPAAGDQCARHVRRAGVPGRAQVLHRLAQRSGRRGRGRAGSQRDWTAGLAVYDIANPAEPRQIGFMPVEGGGIHRIWYTGGRWAYVSAMLDGFTDYIFMTVDMADPTKPKEAGRYWLPGMNTAAGETPSWGANRRFGLHHAIVNGDTAYGAWRDGGLVMMDVSDRTKPKLIKHHNWSPPFGGGTHNCLPLPDRNLLVVADEAVLDDCEDGIKYTWMFDIREPTNPVSISTFPTPDEADYCKKGAHFGPHNIHENRPDTFVSSDLIFATYQNAGIRVFDIRNAFQPKEVGAFVPPEPKRLVDGRLNRAKVIQSCDVLVTPDGVIYTTDFNGGMYILEYQG